MKHILRTVALLAPLAVITVSAPADARRHHYVSRDRDHGNCLRFNKTTGTIAGAVAGGLLGRAVGGGTGTILGAAGGGLAGHELATNRRKRC